MAIAGSLVVTVQARTDDFEQGMAKTRASLTLTEQQATQIVQGVGALGSGLNQSA